MAEIVVIESNDRGTDRQSAFFGFFQAKFCLQFAAIYINVNRPQAHYPESGS
jgi:hypothetical protein